mgnify:CR=1 FL=1
MTVPRLVAMNKYWATSPPVHAMIAAYLGVGKKEEPDDIGDLMRMFPERT